MNELKILLDLLFLRNGINPLFDIWVCITLWICLLILFILFISQISYIFYKIYIKIITSQIITKKVIGKVIRKEYIPERILIGRVRLILPEEYNIHVSYENYEEVINNKDLFNKVEANYSINLNLTKKISKKGKIIEAKLQLPSSN